MVYDCTSLKCHQIFQSFVEVAKYFYHTELGTMVCIDFWIKLFKNTTFRLLYQARGWQRCVESEKGTTEQKSLRNTGLNYTILDKITPLWKRIGEPPEIQIGCYRGDQGQQHYSGSSYDFFWLNKTVRHLCHWNFHLLSFWLALSLLCDVSYVTVNEKFSW